MIDYIPEPYLAMIRAIQPNDLYIIQTLKGTHETVRCRHIPGQTPASEAHALESRMQEQRLSTTRVSGRDLRSLVLEIARGHGFVIPSLSLEALEG